MIEGPFFMRFIGGSRDGAIIEATAAPEHYEVPFRDEMVEIYERQNEEAPFVYLQIGFAGNESWK
jgi:hypothetical protein